MMLGTLHPFFDLKTIIWLLPIVFIFHDLEEIITIESSMTAHKGNDPKTHFVKMALKMRENLGSTAAQLAVSATWILLITSFIAIMTVHGGSFLLFIAILNLYVLQAFMHMFQTIMFKGYTPGIITSLFLLIPYCLLTYYSLAEYGQIDWPLIFTSLPVSLVLIPINLVGNLLGRYFIR